jgi:hypothetical protein
MSPAAAEVLKGLQVPVQVKLYITPADKMPTQLRTLERDLTERMRNFEQVAGGMLEFSVYNPQNDEEMQKTLGAKGIRPFQVQSIEKTRWASSSSGAPMTIRLQGPAGGSAAAVAAPEPGFAGAGRDRPDLPAYPREGAEGGGVRPEEGSRPAAGDDVPAAGHAAAGTARAVLAPARGAAAGALRSGVRWN